MFVVIYEASADFQLATELADRVLRANIRWLETSEALDSNRTWVGGPSDSQPLKWASIKRLARDADIRVHGHFNDAPGAPDSKAARRAIAYVLNTFDNVTAILLVRDLDDQPERQTGLNQARDQCNNIRIIIGVADIERESWVLSGFRPSNDSEQALLTSARQELGFDPTSRPHQLRARNDTAIRSPKQVLRMLTRGNEEREQRCWIDTPLEVLRQNGQNNGLACFMREIEEGLVGVLTGNDSHLERN
jgi:hypothetical protein